MNEKSVSVYLNGKIDSDLNWKQAKEEAFSHIQKGCKIFWELDLGIFSSLRYPITNSSQFLSLKLSVKHFCETLWKELQEHTAGLSLYRGSLDFVPGYIWDKSQEDNLRGWLQDHFHTIEGLNKEVGASFSGFEDVDHTMLSKTVLQLYCRDAVAEFFDLISNHLPLGLQPWVLFDDQAIEDEVHLCNLLSKEHFPHVNVRSNSDHRPDANIAVCLPSYALFRPSEYSLFHKIFSALPKGSFRVIPESRLISEWEGLDYLVVASDKVSSQGKRMLMGFIAAGGTVIVSGPPLKLSNEVSLAEFRIGAGDRSITA